MCGTNRNFLDYPVLRTARYQGWVNLVPKTNGKKKDTIYLQGFLNLILIEEFNKRSSRSNKMELTEQFREMWSEINVRFWKPNGLEFNRPYL